jgi:hypothetical protein
MSSQDSTPSQSEASSPSPSPSSSRKSSASRKSKRSPASGNSEDSSPVLSQSQISISERSMPPAEKNIVECHECNKISKRNTLLDVMFVIKVFDWDVRMQMVILK